MHSVELSKPQHLCKCADHLQFDSLCDAQDNQMVLTSCFASFGIHIYRDAGMKMPQEMVLVRSSLDHRVCRAYSFHYERSSVFYRKALPPCRCHQHQCISGSMLKLPPAFFWLAFSFAVWLCLNFLSLSRDLLRALYQITISSAVSFEVKVLRRVLLCNAPHSCHK